MNDTMNWVEADLSKPLLGHFQAGAFDVGDIVEISRSLGSPHDLHIVSLFLQNVLTITLIFYRSRWSKEDRFRYHLVTWRQISFPLSETTSPMVKKSNVFVTLSNYQLKICNIVNILVYRPGLEGEDQAVHQLHRGRAACRRQHVFQSYKSQTGFEGIHLRGGSGV